jgi:hypothetical protein
MAELERELRVLGTFVELPAERDLVPAVRARLTVPVRRRLRWKVVAVVLAALVIALGVAFAVRPARSAILRFLGLESVRVVRVERLPRAAPGPVAFGRRIPLAQAERQAGFRPLLPAIGSPDAVYVDDVNRYLILLYGRPAARIRLAEASTGPGLITKFTRAEGVEPVAVDGALGLWIKGPHVVIELAGQPRLTGNALLWERNGLLLRLEGKLTKEQALRIARTVRASN